MGKNSRNQAHLSHARRNESTSPRSQEKRMPHLNDWTTIADNSDPREAIYQTLTGQSNVCPKCGGILHQQRKDYLIGNYEGDDELESFTTGANFGWFCDSCPVVVINLPDLHALLAHLPPDMPIGSNAIVIGIINIYAIPEKKRHMPIGIPENQIPLCMFTNLPVLPPKSKMF
jgi:hypothetical protein